MNKAILLVRVSTQVQDLDQQREVVKARAIADGYSEDSLIIIEDKESAVKLKEEERNGLNKLKEFISNDSDIKAVYSYELSRVSRQLPTLYSIRDFLQTHRVQLIILSPPTILFNDDWSVNPSANVLFSIFGALAENEGYLRKERVARGRARAKSLGKFIGGAVLYGYRVNDRGFLKIEPYEADVIRKIFSLYNTGFHSISTVTKELNSLGYRDRNNNYFDSNRVQRVLLQKLYYNGENNHEQIITAAEYEKSRAVAKSQKNYSKIDYSDHIYYCKSLLRAATASSSRGDRYRFLVQKSRAMYYEKHYNYTLSINLIDSLAWQFTKDRKIACLTNPVEVENQRAGFKEQHNTICDKIAQCNIFIVNRDHLIYRAKEMLISERITEADFDRFKSQYESEQLEKEREIIQLESRKQELLQIINSFDAQLNSDAESLANLTDDRLRLDAIRSIVKEILFVERRSENKVVVSITEFSGIEHRFLMSTNSRNSYYETITIDQDGNEVLEPYPVAIERRFKAIGK